MTIRPLLPIVPRQSSQDLRRISVLRLSLPFAAVGSPQVFVPADLHPSRKVEVNDLGHVVVSIPSGKPVRPRLVSL